jgi:uncharacterized protein YkwD
MQLFVDDGVTSRGHRDNIVGEFGETGAGVCDHTGYRHMCVIAYVTQITENNTTKTKK